MERLQATEYYRFSLEYVLELGKALGETAMSCILKHRGRPAAAGVFFKYGRFLHYHLGGSDVELLPLRPNDRMFFEMACWGLANGAQLFHLGGGYLAGDSLFRFKSGFSKDLRDFHVGKIVNDEEMNAVLTKARLKAGKPPTADFFPAYRA
jgi:serine/alanine adding enzyme